MDIGEKLKNLRIKKGKTLKGIGSDLDVSMNSVYRWEKNITKPRQSSLTKLANYYGVSPNWILSGRIEEENVSEYKSNGQKKKRRSSNQDIEQELLLSFG